MFESKDLEYHKNKLYGLYRGYVYDNKDPQNQGRIKAEIPNAYGVDGSGTALVTDWFYPCYPIAGNGWGMNLVPPTKNPDGSKVMIWVAFEMGDKNKPVFMGCPVQANGLQPDALANSKAKMNGTQSGCVFTFTSPKGNQIILNDETGEVKIVAKGALNISAGSAMITAAGGKISFGKNGTITVNRQSFPV